MRAGKGRRRRTENGQRREKEGQRKKNRRGRTKKERQSKTDGGGRIEEKKERKKYTKSFYQIISLASFCCFGRLRHRYLVSAKQSLKPLKTNNKNNVLTHTSAPHDYSSSN